MPAALQPDPGQALAQRLTEPRTAAAVNTLLDHADLLALLVSGLDGLLSRGDTITDSLADGAGELARALRDPDVSRALGFALSIAKTLGRELDRA